MNATIHPIFETALQTIKTPPKTDAEIIAGMNQSNAKTLEKIRVEKLNDQLERLILKMSNEAEQRFYLVLGEAVCQNLDLDLNKVVQKIIEKEYNERVK